MIWKYLLKSNRPLIDFSRLPTGANLLKQSTVRIIRTPIRELSPRSNNSLPANISDNPITSSSNARLSRLMLEKLQLKNLNRQSENISRPSWKQSEIDVSNANPDYASQKSFKNSVEVPYGTKGSVRPDNYKEGASIEVKNYDITTKSGQNRLIDNITKQIKKRVKNLPPNTNQKVVIDARGQNVSNEVLKEIRNSIVNKKYENVEIQFLR